MKVKESKQHTYKICIVYGGLPLIWKLIVNLVFLIISQKVNGEKIDIKNILIVEVNQVSIMQLMLTLWTLDLAACMCVLDIVNE